MANNAPFHIGYSCPAPDEQHVGTLIRHLMSRLGGQRQPFVERRGAIDLDTALLEITLRICADQPHPHVLAEYCQGTLDVDTLNGLSESDRREITLWYEKLCERLEGLMLPLLDTLRSECPRAMLHDQERAVALLVRAGTLSCYMTLNHSAMDSLLTSRIPDGLVAAIKYILESNVPEDASVLQLYFDRDEHNWPYLFMPTTAGFGHFINRYVDLRDSSVRTIHSTAEFIARFQPDPDDALKFLVNPFKKHAE